MIAPEWLFWLLAALQIADAYVTHVGLRRGARERNKFLRWAFQAAGADLPVTLTFKAALLGSLYYYGLTQDWLVPFLVGVYLPVVYNNWRILQAKNS